MKRIKNSNLNQWVNGQPFPLHFLCWLKESLRQASKKELVHFFEREQTSPKVTEAKERALCGGGKKSFPSRRPAGGTTHSASLCIVLSPQPCYGRRIFSFTPHVAFTSLQPTIANSDIYYYHTNHLGSTAFVTDQNQTVTQGFLYAPFGEITTEFNATFGNDFIPKYSFNAKELDEETGMYYYEARYYKPPVFTSRDPMFEKYFWMTPYAYCANNPVKYVDPSGKEALENTDWVKKKGTNQYIWVDYVYDKSSTPAGYDYVGHDDKDILKDMGIPENYSTQQTSRNGYTSKWKPLITFPNRRNESTASLSAHANSTRNPKFASSSNKEGRVFTGITFFASVSQTSYSVDEGLDGMFYNGGLYIGFGDGSYPVYDRLKRPSGAQLNAENHITTVASCTISAQQIISNGIPKNAKVTMGYCNSNSMNLSIVFEWQIIQR